MAGALGILVVFVFVLESFRAKKEKKRFIRSLYDNYGGEPCKKYSPERFGRMGSFYQRHPEDGQLDDITWNDLGMDELFKRMDHTFSASGEEYLYYTLRTPKRDREELQHLEDVICFFDGHADERVRVQFAMNQLGHMGKYSLYDYLDHLDTLGERSNKKNIFMDLLFLPLIAMLWVNFSMGILGIVVLTICNIISYFKEKGEIDPYITSFSYIMRLLAASETLEKIPVPVCRGEWEELRRHRKNMRGMQKNSYWVMSPFRGNSSGNIPEVLMDYIRMVFHVDLIKFNSMLRFLRGHVEDVDGMLKNTGYVETAISVGAFRRSLKNGFCVPEFITADNEPSAVHTRAFDECREGQMSYQTAAGDLIQGEKLRREESVPTTAGIRMAEGYHPLLEKPVKNSISAERGILLTGSNASGKSTFLKTVAVNAILAQTIHTCTAGSYRTPFFYVYSSMALKDDLAGGESYYIVEIKALKRILDAAKGGKKPVLCFVDEVLRGTNTVERIAASTQILKSLSGSGILCFAATHDIELTGLLSGEFENYHFEGDVRDGDVYFNYKLWPGKATTRNAIKLLELMGYDSEITARALAQAARFMADGVWE